MTQLDGPADEGFIPPDPEALLVAQRKAEILAEAAQNPVEPVRPNPDALLEQRRIEVKEAAAKEAESPSLTDAEEDEIVDLIHAGRKEKTFELFGRTIMLRTLTIEEELKISDITKHYMGTDGWSRAYRTAVVAAAMRLLDGKLPLFNPVSESEFDQLIVKKFEKLLDWYPLAVDQIYAQYREMELELLALVEKLGKSSG